jgi:HD superfamily phosphohydrolase
MPGSDGSTLCDKLPLKGEIFSDSIEQYKTMQQQYDKLVAMLEENPELLDEILLLSDAMYELSNHAISRILGDSILYLNVLKQWYEVVRTPIAKYLLAEVYAYKNQFDQAETVLNEIPKLFAFKELELFEHDNYMKFYNFKKQLKLSERNWTQLTQEEIVYLQTIAESANGRSASMAKGVLCFFFDICYEDVMEEESGDNLQKDEIVENKSAALQKQNMKYELSLYPNPTSSEMTVTLNNSAIKIVTMEIYDLTGRKVRQQTVNQSFGILKMNELENGVYVLKVGLENGDIINKRIIKK